MTSLQLLLKVAFLVVLAGTFFFVFPFLGWLYAVAGLALGAWIAGLDHLLYTWYGDELDPVVQTGQWYIDQKKWLAYVGWVWSTRSHPRYLLSRSILLTVVLSIITFYAVTTTDQYFGWGFLFGWHAQTLSLWLNWRDQPALFWNQVGWQIVWQPSAQQINYLVGGYTVVTAVLLGFLIF